MPKHDPRLDAYIERSADFAHPILTYLRSVIHEACPTVEETIKWSAPFYMYEGILCSTPAFKRHCAMIMWKGRLLPKADAKYVATELRKISSLADLPSRKKLAGYIKALMKMNEDGTKSARRSRPKFTKPLVIPTELKRAIARNSKAKAAFAEFPPSHKREYADWIADAKRPETRDRRIKTAVEMIAEGKSRNWKYEKR